jgi:serine/threonine-protein kinase RsbW
MQLRVPGTLQYRDLAVRAVGAACKLVGSNPEHPEFDREVLSAFGEAFNNAALHSYEAESGDVEILVEVASDRITIEIRDNGASFDPALVPKPDLDALPESGLGLYIIRSFMDEVEYRPGSPNILSMTKRLAPPPLPGGENQAHESNFTRFDKGDQSVLQIAGVLDAVSAPQLRTLGDNVVGEKRPAVTLDLSGLRLLDNVGTSAIIDLYKRLRALGGRLEIVGLRDQPLKLIRLLRLDRIL